jgi:hypothetical protein
LLSERQGNTNDTIERQGNTNDMKHPVPALATSYLRTFFPRRRPWSDFDKLANTCSRCGVLNAEHASHVVLSLPAAQQTVRWKKTSAWLFSRT